MFVCVFMVVLLFVGCDNVLKFQNFDIIGNMQFGSDFVLFDMSGKVCMFVDFKGKVVVMFFGYMYCLDVCLIMMVELFEVLKQFGLDVVKCVQVLFVIVDLECDMLVLFGQYVFVFDLLFIGLWLVDEVQFKKVMKDFCVYYVKVFGKMFGSYMMDYMVVSYVFDCDGKLCLFVCDGQGLVLWVYDLKLLVD